MSMIFSQIELDKKYAEIQQQTQQAEDNALIHPALEFIKDMCVVGFRERKRADGKIFTENVYMLFTSEGVTKQVSSQISMNDKEYYVDHEGKLLIDLRERLKNEDISWLLEGGCVSPREVYTAIYELYKQFIYLSKDQEYHLITAWTIGTYFHRLFFSIPFLHIKAPKSSGKSQVLGCLYKLCFNASKGRPTVASLGDIITGTRGTILYDQADSLQNEHNYEIREILADSYKKDGGKRRVMDMSKGRKILEFETYSPKAFASMIELPEDLRDRCLLIPIVRTTANYPTPDDQNEDWSKYRAQLYALLRKSKEVDSKRADVLSKYKESKVLMGRELDLWVPIETMFDFCNVPEDTIGAVREYYRQLTRYTTFYPKDHEQEMVTYLLTRFGSGDEVTLSVKEITKDLKSKHEIFSSYYSDQENVEWSERKVGHTINNFNLSSRKLRRSEGVYYLFEKDKIANVSRQYFSDEEDALYPELENEVVNVVRH